MKIRKKGDILLITKIFLGGIDIMTGKQHMTTEQMDHFLRHVKMHAEELRNGTFCKDATYLYKLREAQDMALEISHEIFHIMRTKGFEKYEGDGFMFYTKLPENLEQHEFRDFDYESFRLGCKIKRATDMILCDEKDLELDENEVAKELEILGNAIQDAGVLLKLLENHFVAA